MGMVLKRRICDEPTNCDRCQTPILEGEHCYVHEQTWTVGCGLLCCETAAKEKQSTIGSEESSNLTNNLKKVAR